MAQPTYYPLWATEDTTLPATDNTNKERPKTTLQTIGWDKGQIPSAEEMNWMLNNIYLWVLYFNEEALPTYLPITGTSITLTGRLQGLQHLQALIHYLLLLLSLQAIQEQ